MNVFDLRDRLVGDYSSYTRSFIKIADGRISRKVDSELDAGAFWPEPLLQLNPTFLPGGTIDDLVKGQTLHPECRKIFRLEKSNDDDSLQFIAKVNSSKLLKDNEINQVKDFLREALGFLKNPKAAAINIDADPRNADWLKIHHAHRLAGYYLPAWATLWLWWLRTDTSPKFWRSVGKIAKELGYEPFLPGEQS